MSLEHLEGKRIILGSKSPRRKELFSKLGLPFEVESSDVEELYPKSLAGREVPVFLAALKNESFGELDKDVLLVTSDTVVVYKGKIIEKPKDYEDAFRMLKQLSGDIHKVFTGVCIRENGIRKSFVSKTTVEFANLTDDEIDYYIKQSQPYDKAGGYGIQEWIGHIGVKSITGCYYNVMGLPISKLYKHLKAWR
ncbi:MAG: septum formation protein [Sphingobacteriales bacterium]|jgi:septum formation protein